MKNIFRCTSILLLLLFFSSVVFAQNPDSNQSFSNIRFAEPLQIHHISANNSIIRIYYILDGNLPIGPVTNTITGALNQSSSNQFWIHSVMQPGIVYQSDSQLSFSDCNRLIRVTLDANQNVSESDETDNVQFITASLNCESDSNTAGLPNIRVVSPLQILQNGSQKTLRILYTLDASQSAGPITSKITGSGSTSASTAFFTSPVLVPGTVYLFDQNLSFLDCNRLIQVDLDHNNSVSESNESDNGASTTVSLNCDSNQLLPNLVIDHIIAVRFRLRDIVEVSNNNFQKFFLDANNSSTWFVYATVKNIGNAIALPSTLRLDANADINQFFPPRFFNTPQLAPGFSAGIRTNFSNVNGSLRLKAIADYYNQILESNENDNTRYFP